MMVSGFPQKAQSRSQRPRSFWSATGIGTSGIIRFPTTGFLLSSRLRRPKPVWRMASNSEDSFHEAIKFSLDKLGKPDLELKREQFEAIRAVCVERKDVLAVLPTGFGKSLIYQILPAIFDSSTVNCIYIWSHRGFGLTFNSKW